jgi:aldose 1-epimerase
VVDALSRATAFPHGGIELRAGDLRLVVLPELGGGVARFDLVRSDGVAALFRPWDGARADPNTLGCYVLCPFSNRISGGGLAAGDRLWPLFPNVADEPYPIHGDAWQQRWTVVESSGTALGLVLESGAMPPFAYRAQLSYELADHALTARLTVQHQGGVAVSYGLGLHPWLPRTPATTLQAAAEAVWLERPDHLPDRCVTIGERPDWDFRAPRRLPDSWVNNGFVGWDGRAQIAWPERGLGLEIAASDALRTYVLYAPGAEAGFFCFEPVSHAVDAFHLPGGPQAHGLKLLQAGASFGIECRFVVTEDG